MKIRINSKQDIYWILLNRYISSKRRVLFKKKIIIKEKLLIK